MRVLAVFICLAILTGCNKEKEESDLERFIAQSKGLSEDFLIACAAGNENEFMGNSTRPISVFFYNVDGASSAELYVKSEEGNKDDYCNYQKSSEVPEVLFNGRMGRFSVSTEYTARWVIVAYKTGTTYNVSDPILIRSDTHATKDISDKLVQSGDSLQPAFNWHADYVKGNVIYFSLISNDANDFVSGVYTTEKEWQFYDLSNVVLNVTPTTNPVLSSQENYTYTHMGVGADNWVRTFGVLPF